MQPRINYNTAPAAITFELYSADEIRKMSVVEVITPLSISATGQGLPGGLYDPKMGPHSQFGKCLTCQKNLMHCSGHLGHIELPLPVINPLFNKTVLQIFRLSCLNCNFSIVPGPLKYMTVAQLKLLSYGMLEAALNAEYIMVEITGETDKESKQKAVSLADAEFARSRFEDYVQSCLIRKEKTKGEISGAVDGVKQKIVQKILGLAKMSYKCPHCSTVVRRMTQAESKILYSMTKASKFSGRKKGGEEPMDIMEEIEKDEEDKGGAAGVRQKYLTPLEAKNHLRAVWAKEKDFLENIFPVLQSAKTEFPTDNFFIEVLPVTPPKNRPSQTVNNMLMEHPHNLAYRHVVTSCAVIQYLLRAMSGGLSSLSEESQKVLRGIQGQSLEEKLENTWNQLQADVDHVMDRDRNAGANQNVSQMIGLKQIIERKEGLFRMNMMGKRVNYAARTVITPDPNISIDEIGIPDVFAKVLTYPCTVTPASVYFLRQLVLNGPNNYPGAVAVRDENGTMTRLHPTDQAQREGVANRLLVSDPLKETSFTGVKIVYRHLQNGDMLLLNRQPSLHRPSIMAHRARVLQGEKVFRLHYANCKHYNADFDGDEMNAHFPQDEESRAEAATLANVCNHFLVPKDGTPLGGLIQDHVVGAVKLTIRGRFFTEEDYHELVYFALGGYSKRIILEPPCMFKPMLLWSGKQVVSTIVKNLIPPSKLPLTFTSMAKIKSKEWRQWESRPWKAGGPLSEDEMSESVVIFRRGELLSGVLDKVHLGATAFGLCHAFYELYGSVAVGSLLSAFSKLMTNFLQWEGFTLGVKDVLVMPEADEIRRVYMEKASQVGPEAAAKGVGLPLDSPVELIEKSLESIHRSRDPKRRAIVDQSYKQALDRFTNKINSTCLPYGLVSIFPHNNLQLLVQSGAKGSTVNTMQMSCLLGQIELEGKRPPLTLAGKSLPSFRPYDLSPRAGGFILGRFLTGIRPQEFFFHCMAGREGLIDTAVKTSRSGYLQRCLVKLLEGVVINYDMTVRDSDDSIVQFLYGEDGLDVAKSQYLKSSQFQFLQENASCVVRSKLSNENNDEINSLKSKIKKCGAKDSRNRQSGFLNFCKVHDREFSHLAGFNEETGRPKKAEALEASWRTLSAKERERYRRKAKRCPDPVLGQFLPTNFGVVSEKLDSTVKGYSEDEKFCDVAYSKAMEALASPGDAVGVLAAQSLGEPSTQMTLNTFHFAGRGEMNVTLGIPRLREILMVASENIKTPCMDIPFKDGVAEAQAEKLRLKLTRVTMDQVLQRVDVTEKLDRFGNRLYTLKFVFLPYSEYADTFYVKPNTVLKYFEKEFLTSVFLPAVRRAMKVRKSQVAVHTEVEGQRSGLGNSEENDEEASSSGPKRGGREEEAPADLFGEAERRGQGEEHESSDEEEVADDADATQSKRHAKQVDLEYEEPEEEERIGNNDDEPDADNSFNTVEDPENAEDIAESFIRGNEEVNEKLRFSVARATSELRRSHVMALDTLISGYNFDRKRQEWCEIILQTAQGQEKVNMGLLLQEVAKKATIHQISQINRAFVSRKDDRFYLRTEGINILAMAPFQHLLDLNRLHCNNIHKMANHYGIEAALKVLVKELSDVFKAYGIVIDPRHLNLIADYMTRSGVYRPFNRIGIAHSTSPLHQMSFETVVSFLREATLAGKKDNLMNPSSRLIVGKPVHVGTDLIECHVPPSGVAGGSMPATAKTRNLRANRLSNNIYCSLAMKQPRKKYQEETSNNVAVSP